MNLNDQTAYRLSRSLTSIDGCPRNEEALDGLAEDLQEICDSQQEAEWLVKEARWTWDRWHGTAGLLRLLNAKRRPAATPRDRQPAPDLGPKPPILCAACNDYGIIRRAGRHEWCTCEQAARMQADMPGWLETLNRSIFGALPAAQENRPISEEQLEKEFRENQARYDRIIAEARAILEDPETPANRREIALATIRQLGGTV